MKVKLRPIVSLWISSLLFFLFPFEAGAQTEAPRAPGISPAVQEELLRTAEQSLQDKQFPEAIAIYRQVLNDYPETPLKDKIYIKLGQALLKNQEAATAVSTFQKYMREYPESPDLTLVLGELGFAYLDTV